MQTKVRDGAPAFRWTVSEPSTELRLTVYGAEGVHWQHEVPKGTTSIAYPPDAPGLVPGVMYSWVLETTDPLILPPLRSEAAFFEILSADENRQVDASLDEISQTRRPGESTYHFVCASVYFGHGLMEDAIAETTKALAADPENKELHAILARLYAETGRNEEAVREYNRLLEQR
jgi:tetratricopeptide (TPR) repeat protein